MNERTIELAKKAGLKKDHAADREYIGDFDWREFANLIVQDCAEVLLKWKQEPFPFDEDLAVSLIKEHFGIKK